LFCGFLLDFLDLCVKDGLFALLFLLLLLVLEVQHFLLFFSFFQDKGIFPEGLVG